MDVEKEKNCFSKECLIDGLLICSVLHAFLAASVPALTNQYYLPLHGGILNQYLVFVLIDLLFFICALIYLASGLIAAWKVKSLKHRYREKPCSFSDKLPQN